MADEFSRKVLLKKQICSLEKQWRDLHAGKYLSKRINTVPIEPAFESFNRKVETLPIGGVDREFWESHLDAILALHFDLESSVFPSVVFSSVEEIEDEEDLFKAITKNVCFVIKSEVLSGDGIPFFLQSPDWKELYSAYLDFVIISHPEEPFAWLLPEVLDALGKLGGPGGGPGVGAPIANSGGGETRSSGVDPPDVDED